VVGFRVIAEEFGYTTQTEAVTVSGLFNSFSWPSKGKNPVRCGDSQAKTNFFETPPFHNSH
jgi:hypothetical protein